MIGDNSLSLIFMGTPEFAVPCLQTLLSSKHNVVAVYTQPPRPSGRGYKLRPSPVQQIADLHNIPVYCPTNLRDKQVQNQFCKLQADAAIVAAYGLILPPEILNACPLGCINIHPSKLPRWRGAAPIQRTIMAGDTETAMTIMQMDTGLDTGDILLQETISLEDGTTAGQLHDIMAQLAGPTLLKALTGLQNNAITPIPQPNTGITYAPKIDKSETAINWAQSAATIRQQILGLSPYPAAYFTYQQEKIKILDAEIVEIESHSPATKNPNNIPTKPGMVLDNRLTIACDDCSHAIRPITIQRSGKKAMHTADMLRGLPINAGTLLSSKQQ